MDPHEAIEQNKRCLCLNLGSSNGMLGLQSVMALLLLEKPLLV